MKVIMSCINEGDSSNVWDEPFDTENTSCLVDAPEGLSARQYAEMLVENFNSTLKPGERRREVVGVVEDITVVEEEVEYLESKVIINYDYDLNELDCIESDINDAVKENGIHQGQLVVEVTWNPHP